LLAGAAAAAGSATAAAAAGPCAASVVVAGLAAVGRLGTHVDLGDTSASGLPALACQSSNVGSRLGGISTCSNIAAGNRSHVSLVRVTTRRCNLKHHM
jgi:hypothetical protein